MPVWLCNFPFWSCWRGNKRRRRLEWFECRRRWTRPDWLQIRLPPCPNRHREVLAKSWAVVEVVQHWTRGLKPADSSPTRVSISSVSRTRWSFLSTMWKPDPDCWEKLPLYKWLDSCHRTWGQAVAYPKMTHWGRQHQTSRPRAWWCRTSRQRRWSCPWWRGNCRANYQKLKDINNILFGTTI